MAKAKIGLGVSGGIAAYKAVEILRALQRESCSVQVAMTRHACEFVTPLTFRAISGTHVIVDDYAADNPDPIAHINFSQHIDLLLIAPATANILAKMANGVADDFLTSTFLACTAPILVAPAMNTVMWDHPTTRRNIATLRSDGVYFVEPDSGEMACGTFGPGRLSAPEVIAQRAIEILDISRQEKRDLSAEMILITAGATREEIDPVRFISNRSSGRMGFALAEAALARGATVTIVAGVTAVEPPAEATLIRVQSAEEMSRAVSAEVSNATIFIGAAAVSDYRPVNRNDFKIKKLSERLTIELERTPDILGSVAAERHPRLIVVGFAAETNDVEAHALKKLEKKRLDLIVANDVTNPRGGFDVSTNVVSIIRSGQEEPLRLPELPKLEVANRVLDIVREIRESAGAASSKSS
jgi:phosphopantothenoylcysteine decarboxylase / phosphopantothenate---cysteine ligase